MVSVADFMDRANEAFGESEPKQQAGGQSNNGQVNVGSYLDHHDIGYKIKSNGTRTVYALDHCVFDSSHVNNDAAIFQDTDGKLGHKCFHDSCQGKGWRDVRQVISGDTSLREFMPGYQANGSKTEESKTEWPEPEPIKAELKPVEPLRESMIPAPFLPMIKDTSERMSIPYDYVAIPLMVVTGSVIGTICRIKPKRKDDWAIVPNLWGGIVGPPSRLKSPALEEVVKKLLGRLEAEAIEKHTAQKLEWMKDRQSGQLSKSVLESEFKSALKAERSGKKPKGRDANEILNELQGLLEDGEPKERRYKTNDCSVEKMVELLRDNLRGILYFRDEIIGLFRRMDRQGNEQDRAFFLEGWSGNGSHTDDRIGRGTIRAEKLCFSLLGSIQPSKLSGYLRQALSKDDNDGFVQRLQLMVYPDMPKFEYCDRWPDVESKNRCYDILKGLANSEFDAFGQDNDFEEDEVGAFLRFDDEAQEIFEMWFMDLQEKVESEDEHPALVEHLGKYRSLMPSLALIFHLIEIADGTGKGSVSKRVTLQACAWCDYLETHARRIFGMVIDGAAIAAGILSRKIKSRKLASPFKVRTIQRKGWGRLTDNAEVREAVLYLADAGWVREKEPDQKRFGRPADLEYEINPKIFP